MPTDALGLSPDAGLTFASLSCIMPFAKRLGGVKEGSVEGEGLV